MLYHWRDLEEISPQYDDCPNVCGETGKPTQKFCENCPQKEAEEIFKEQVTEILDERCPGEWQKYGLENIRRNVIDVSFLAETDPKEWSIQTDRLVKVWLSEKTKQMRVDRWNAEQQRKAAHES